MALPGTPGQRISDLCNGNHITQKELAEKIGVSASQLSRIVSGETRTVSSDILIGVAKEFKVSTDYILGLSTVSVRKSYDISELGLSEGAVRGLVTGAVISISHDRKYIEEVCDKIYQLNPNGLQLIGD